MMHRSRFFSQPWSRTVALWGASSLIRSVQRGTITIGDTSNSNTATITAVNTAYAYVRVLGYTSGPAAVSSQAERFPAVVLTNATTVTASRTTNGGAGGPTIILSYEVVEVAPGSVRSVQAVPVPITNGNTSATATITAVDMSKSEVLWGGLTTDSATGATDDTAARVVLTSATQLTATRIGTGGAVTPYVTVVERQ